MDYETRDLTPEEAQALTKEMTELLEKHNAEIGVISHIQILKRVEKKDILSPIQHEGGNTETPKPE